MLFSNISVLMPDYSVKDGMYVGVKGSFVEYVSDEPPKEDFGESYSGGDRLLMPAMADAHAHAPMTLLRGLGGGLPLDRWLNEAIFPFEAKLRADDIYFGTLLAIAEMARFGIASSTEMYYFGESMARAALEAGFKMNASLAVLCFDEGQSLKDIPVFRENDALFSDFDGAGSGLFRVEFSAHAEYTTTERVIRELAEHCARRGAGVHIHAAETESETAACRERRGGRSPIRYLADCGILDIPATLAHCVWLTEEDVLILAEKAVTAAACPASNMKLRSGVCDVRGLLDAGVNVALGTDGAASNNRLDMLGDARLLALSSGISATEALAAASIAAYAAQRRLDCGAIAPGMRADIAVLDTSGPHWCPRADMAENLLFSAMGSDVVLTMCDGAVIYRDGQFPTIDIDRIRAEAERRRAELK